MNIAGYYRFIEVTGEDGTFYDLVHQSCVKDHIRFLTDEQGYQAKVVRRKSVPPCLYRDFSVSLSAYRLVSLDGGEDFYFDHD